MKILLPEEAREQLGIRRETRFEVLTQNPKDMAFLMACNVTCEYCSIQRYCKENLKEDDDCQDIWLKWLGETE